MVPPLGKRARQVLYAVVTEFIDTGEPVASRAIARKHGFDLSAATIRSVLADLEEAGYLAQPHTSAGRVPTDLAFRLFIDALMSVRRLSEGDHARISTWLEHLKSGADIPRETGRLLSDLTGAPAVVVRPRAEARTALKLHFIATRPGELLAVVVFGDGTVENRFIAVDPAPSAAEIDRLHALLSDVVEGRTLTQIRDHLVRLRSEHQDALHALSAVGATLVSAAIGGVERSEVVIEGRTRLLEQDAGDHSLELLRALEDHEHLVSLLERAIATERVQVFLGADTQSTTGYALGVVAAPYHDDAGRPGGAVGIIGPTRMDYPTLVPIVGAAADAMSTALARSRGALAPTPDRDDPSE